MKGLEGNPRSSVRSSRIVTFLEFRLGLDIRSSFRTRPTIFQIHSGYCLYSHSTKRPIQSSVREIIQTRK